MTDGTDRAHGTAAEGALGASAYDGASYAPSAYGGSAYGPSAYGPSAYGGSAYGDPAGGGAGRDGVAEGGGGPSREFVNTLACWTWLERTAAGPAAFLLLAHPEAGTVQTELYALASALRLVPPARRIADVGARVAIVGGDRAAVRLDRCPHMVQVAVGARWADFAAAGGPVALVVGLTPLERSAPRSVVEPYLARAAMRGLLRLGLAESVGSFTEDEAFRHGPRHGARPGGHGPSWGPAATAAPRAGYHFGAGYAYGPGYGSGTGYTYGGWGGGLGGGPASGNRPVAGAG